MKKKTSNKIIFSLIIVTTVLLVGLGVIFSKSEFEKINGLANVFDVSDDGLLAYVYYEEGKPSIYLKRDDEISQLIQLTDAEEIVDIAFTTNGNEIVYAGTNWEKEDLHSGVHAINIATTDRKQLFELEGLITELAVDAKNEHQLFYLKASTFENYSPIAQAHPHEYDIYHYDREKNEHIQHTKLAKYSMSSLQVSKEKEVVYVQMDDDITVKTAEELFDTKQRVFEISLATGADMKVVTNPTREVDVFDFAFFPDEEALVFQSISNSAAGGTYEYELYYYDLTTKEEEQLTNFATFTERPVISKRENKIYFIENEHFATDARPNYRIYSMDFNGEQLNEVHIDPLESGK